MRKTRLILTKLLNGVRHRLRKKYLLNYNRQGPTQFARSNNFITSHTIVTLFVYKRNKKKKNYFILKIRDDSATLDDRRKLAAEQHKPYIVSVLRVVCGVVGQSEFGVRR